MKLKLGISPCPNDTWIFGALVLGHVSVPGVEWAVDFQDVQTLNEQALDQQFDVQKISFGTWIQAPMRKHQLLRCGGAMGYGCGPLLLTNEQGTELPDEVLLPGKDTTAHALFHFWARHKGWKGVVRQESFEQIYRKLLSSEAKMGVAIHECRFTWHKDGLQQIVDLGAFWEEKVQAPIPLGGIVLRGELAQIPGLKDQIEAGILASLDWAEAHPEQLTSWMLEKAQMDDLQVLKAHIDLYVNAFSRDIGAEGMRGIQALLDHV